MTPSRFAAEATRRLGVVPCWTQLHTSRSAELVVSTSPVSGSRRFLLPIRRPSSPRRFRPVLIRTKRLSQSLSLSSAFPRVAPQVGFVGASGCSVRLVKTLCQAWPPTSTRKTKSPDLSHAGDTYPQISNSCQQAFPQATGGRTSVHGWLAALFLGLTSLLLCL